MTLPPPWVWTPERWECESTQTPVDRRSWHPSRSVFLQIRSLTFRVTSNRNALCDDRKNNAWFVSSYLLNLFSSDELFLGHEKAPAFRDYVAVARGSSDHNVRAQEPESGLSEEVQVKCLIDQATDPNILGRTWEGWEPWMWGPDESADRAQRVFEVCPELWAIRELRFLKRSLFSDTLLYDKFNQGHDREVSAGVCTGLGHNHRLGLGLTWMFKREAYSQPPASTGWRVSQVTNARTGGDGVCVCGHSMQCSHW